MSASPSAVLTATANGRPRPKRHRPVSWRRRLLAAATVLAASACGGGSDGGTSPGALTITPTSPSIRVGSSVQLRANGATGSVSWSSNDQSVATVVGGLVTGVAGGVAEITAQDGDRSAQVQVTVTRPPTIALSVNSLDFSTSSNGAVPGAITVGINNGGDETVDGLAVGTITYGAGASGWLQASVAGTSAPTAVSVQPTTAALPNGTYTATVPITSTTAVNSPRTITVSYTVSPTPVIVLGQSSASFTVQSGSPAPAAQQVSITNGGGATLSGLSVQSIAYGAGATGWLTATINPTTAPTNLTLQPNTGTLNAGDYTATVTVHSSVPGVANKQLTVTYHVVAAPPPPSIALGTGSVSFIATAGGSVPAAQTVSISNGGGGTLSGLTATITYVSGTAGWLTKSLSGTTAPATLTLQPGSVPAAGLYTAQVAIASGVASNSPQIINVSYTVNPPPQIGLSATTASFLATAANVDPPSQTIDVSNTGGGTLTGLVPSITYNPSNVTPWLQASVASTAPLAPSSTPLTLAVTTGTIVPGTYKATVTLSAPGVTSKSVTVTFVRQATLAGDVMPIFTSSPGNCASCHSGASPAEGIALDSTDKAYASLVNHPSVSVPSETLVIPGDSLNSYLYKELVGSGANLDASDIMPAGCTPGSTCLSASVVHIIAMWIQQGARKSP